ncbi:hypothetical protein [Arcobacter sp. LA11]|uniref:hypothetical protein n=1 Tax=Arcobacter sp. LA11 TaxID=1898176 RepID=UPI0009336AEF|nr:hypothetical protein [Arcobacter sp. LA11]
MNIATLIKNNLTKVPYSIGKTVNLIPYSLRPGIGSIYQDRTNEIKKFSLLNGKQKDQYIFNKMKSIVEYSEANIKFYKDYYKSQGFSSSMLNKFDDINRIPIISKSILRDYDLEVRSCPQKNRYIVNTGGTSGTPLSLYITPDSMGNEWAHMHDIWSRIGFNYSELKMVFGGRSNVTDGIEYDFVRHSYAIDMYKYPDYYEKILKVFQTKELKYFHGYPSAIYDFVNYLEKHEELLALVRKNIKGVLLGSEYPLSLFRDKIESVLKVKTISWYGHTERVILAGEKEERGRYYPFQTYGYTEAVKINDKYNLVGTSYYNITSPFIRYNTEDIIDDINYLDDSSILESFTVSDARVGDFIVDKNGNNIPLTALIFGRHHELFNYVSHLQIAQKEEGKAVVYYVFEKELDCEKLFDSSNIFVDFEYKKLDEPIRTKAGKVTLKVPYKNINIG